MSDIIVLSGSNSAQSINTQFLHYITGQIDSIETVYVKLTDFFIPIYNLDIEQERGIPVDIQILKNKITASSGLIIAVNEHNGSISAFFKNIIDWLSRADRNFLADKKILLVSTSPGARGAATALQYAKQTFPRFGGQVVESFSLPSFQENFDVKNQEVIGSTLKMGINEVLASFLQQISNQ